MNRRASITKMQNLLYENLLKTQMRWEIYLHKSPVSFHQEFFSSKLPPAHSIFSWSFRSLFFLVAWATMEDSPKSTPEGPQDLFKAVAMPETPTEEITPLVQVENFPVELKERGRLRSRSGGPTPDSIIGANWPSLPVSRNIQDQPSNSFGQSYSSRTSGQKLQPKSPSNICLLETSNEVSGGLQKRQGGKICPIL